METSNSDIRCLLTKIKVVHKHRNYQDSHPRISLPDGPPKTFRKDDFPPFPQPAAYSFLKERPRVGLDGRVTLEKDTEQRYI